MPLGCQPDQTLKECGQRQENLSYCPSTCGQAPLTQEHKQQTSVSDVHGKSCRGCRTTESLPVQKLLIDKLHQLRRYIKQTKRLRVLAFVPDLLRRHTSTHHRSFVAFKKRTSPIMYACSPSLERCVVFHTLSSSSRWSDMETLFGKHRPQLSEIFN